jgi:hypothetical protein
MTIRAHLFGLPNTQQNVASQLLTQFAIQQKCSLQKIRSHAEDFDVFTILDTPQGHTSIFCRWSAWWDFHAFLIREFPKPILFFHMYEDDFWQYDLYVSGEIVDSYNVSLPFYEQENQPNETDLQMKPFTLSKYWPSINIKDINNYFTPWRQEEYIYINPVVSEKAYNSDMYRRGDTWQLADFMQKLGLIFPISDNRVLLGQTYKLIHQKS